MPQFNSANIGIWFYFDPTNEALGGVCLRELSTEENRRIEQMTIKKRKKIRRGVAYDDPQVDEKLASKMRWDFCITDWKEVSLDGQQLECNDENKVRMMKVIDFVKHVVDSLEKLVEMNQTIEEARVKNLPPSSSGSVEGSGLEPAVNA